MKKVIIVIMVLFTLCLAGDLYNTLAQLDKLEPGTTEQTFATPFPHEMPDVIMSPMPGVPLY